MSECIKCLKRDLRNSTDRYEALEQDVITMAQQIGAKELEISSLKEERDNARGCYDRLYLRNQRLKRENDQLRLSSTKKWCEMESQRDSARASFDWLQHELAVQVKERDSARRYNKTLINVNSDLRDELKELKLKNLELASNPPVIMQCCKKCK
jgi:FtsZ-binding cell division protein ZapB